MKCWLGMKLILFSFQETSHYLKTFKSTFYVVIIIIIIIDYDENALQFKKKMYIQSWNYSPTIIYFVEFLNFSFIKNRRKKIKN